MQTQNVAHRFPPPEETIGHELIRGYSIPCGQVATPRTQEGEHRLCGPHQDEARVHVAASGAEGLAHEAKVDTTSIVRLFKVTEEEPVWAQRHDIEVRQ